MLFTNSKLSEMLEAAQNYIDRKDIIGYAAARNVRRLKDDVLVEFNEKKNALLSEYGSPYVDSNGNPTGGVYINPDSPNYSKFMEEYSKFSEIEHDFDIFKIKFDNAINNLTGSELLEIDWMFED